jgi:HD-GYP domain-containing protein (c-di-GMP phosphodiesterase class II)
MAAAHHEKLDGSGYHRGLDATALTLPMRLLAVADVYEALTADRPYRAGMPPEEALAIVEGQRGTGLDPASVDVLAGQVHAGRATPLAREAEEGATRASRLASLA